MIDCGWIAGLIVEETANVVMELIRSVDANGYRTNLNETMQEEYGQFDDNV